MPTNTKEKIEKLKKQQVIIKARIQRMTALESGRERKRETRRKILVGSCFLDKAKKDGSMNEIVKVMDGFLTRDSDRELFNLNT